MRLQSRQRHVL